MSCQIVHDSFHARGFTDSYLLKLDGRAVGYGSVAGNPRGPRETVKEFYVVPGFRRDTLKLFRAMLAVATPRWIEAQTNDRLLTLLLFDCGTDVASETILFADAQTTHHPPSGEVGLRRLADEDRALLFPHSLEAIGDWVLAADREIVATGGLMFHYNPPYGDIYMEVAPAHRGRGHGSYLVQELKRICYEQGRVPAARCPVRNAASRRTLERAGMLPCARILRARLTT